MTAGRSERINGPLCVSESAFLCFVSVDGAVGDCGWWPVVGVCWCGRVGEGRVPRACGAQSEFNSSQSAELQSDHHKVLVLTR